MDVGSRGACFRFLAVAASLSLMTCADPEPDATPVPRPSTPLLSVNVALKQLELSWGATAGAERYELVLDLAEPSAVTRVSLPVTESRYALDIAVHKVGWEMGSATLEACNGGGCSPSAPVRIDGRSNEAIGYFKASATRKNETVGGAVSVSGNGRTLAVGAPGRDESAGVVYIFSRDGTTWRQEAELKGRFTELGDRFGSSVALSADGDTLAVGAPSEDSAALGVNGRQNDNTRPASGATYVFVRSGSAWSQQAYLKASNADLGDAFGSAVALSADGNTLAAGAPQEDSGALRVNGGQARNDAPDAGAAYVFVRNSSTWTQQAYVKATNTDSEDWFGQALALADDGDTLAVGAPLEDSAATGVGGNQTNNDLTKAGAVYLYGRSGTDWQPPVYIKASNSGLKDWFGWTVALSGDGATLAVASPEEDGASSGINGNQGTNNKPNAGAVYIFVLTNSGQWAQQAYVKASNPDTEDELGWALGLSDNGDTLVVGAPGEASIASGVGGTQGDNSRAASGAAYAFVRASGVWAQRGYCKAPNTGKDDRFGHALGLASDGNLLLVGAPFEDSAATGIGGNQADNSRTDAGAAYLY